VLLKFFLFALLLGSWATEGGYAEAWQTGHGGSRRGRRGKGMRNNLDMRCNRQHFFQPAFVSWWRFFSIFSFFLLAASRKSQIACCKLRPGGYCYGQDIAHFARNEKKGERIALRAVLSGNNNLAVCIRNLCAEWANLAGCTNANGKLMAKNNSFVFHTLHSALRHPHSFLQSEARKRTGCKQVGINWSARVMQSETRLAGSAQLRWDSDWIRGLESVAQSFGDRDLYIHLTAAELCCTLVTETETCVFHIYFAFIILVCCVGTASELHEFSLAGFLTALFRFSTFPLNIRTR